MGDRRQIGGQTFGSFHDPRGIMNYRDLPCPYICCNFLTVDFNAINGPTRQIPGTQHSREPIPTLKEEPDWMKLSTVCPAPAGSVLIRDIRLTRRDTQSLRKSGPYPMLNFMLLGSENLSKKVCPMISMNRCPNMARKSVVTLRASPKLSSKQVIRKI